MVLSPILLPSTPPSYPELHLRELCPLFYRRDEAPILAICALGQIYSSCTSAQASSVLIKRLHPLDHRCISTLCNPLIVPAAGHGTPTPSWPRRLYGTSSPQASSAQTTQPAPETCVPPTPLSDQIRLLMRRVPYPVAIITATDPHGPVDQAFRGMTVSSFNTVTLHPEPVVSFNVRRPSETLAALQSSRRFLVHLLAPTPATASLARDFSRGNHNLALLAGEGDFEFAPHVPTAAAVDADACDRALPILRRRPASVLASASTSDADPVQEDFPFVFECRLNPQSVEVHDHTIVVGTVVRALSPHVHGSEVEKPGAGFSAKELCLTYANTRFWGMGHEI
ncbi:flavin reductase family protein [Aspergillus clavatus NRRL 1]|uniref:Puatative oxidoreductase n=1 Tax=Aspergillus clavatus (strain ATCC 1007 / CBS 513.65 / DSM 816 / NCTC 3887 / NRRL 1 / QM 1276 / 107) TaxID=344612 RepID=A1CIK1_ASPCL|nr:putative oxidoreductase [Aspergillus clavatus NRRL 1]EAW10706.1 puatative oxidoreductase [Aspergillus clavatus NRRL 1]